MSVTQVIQIEINPEGDTISTTLWQLTQWKYALKLEKTGLTMSRGRKVSTHLRKLLKVSRQYPISKLSDWVEATIAQVNGCFEQTLVQVNEELS
jgi:hypothetical protein